MKAASFEYVRPDRLESAIAFLTEHGEEAKVIAGGQSLVPMLAFRLTAPRFLVDIGRISELRRVGIDADGIRLGALARWRDIERNEELHRANPLLVEAIRHVAHYQIRNRGTVGGNLGTSSPAGDAHPPLLAADAQVEVHSKSGVRRIPVREFFTGPKKNAMLKDELIAAFLVAPAPGPQQFSKVGTRNAMVIAVCSFALDVDPANRRVGTGIGSAGPTPLRAVKAEEFIQGELDWDNRRPPSDATMRRFGELVAAAAKPIDDVRGTAAYRRHALAVMARRCLHWCWT